MIARSSIIRVFSIDLHAGSERHDQIMNTLLDEPNARAAVSGHTGFLVEICDDARTDQEIILSLRKRLAGFRKEKQLYQKYYGD